MKYVVTGANRGIGLEFVRKLAKRGDKVVATARQPQDAKELHELEQHYPGQITIEALDVSKPKSVAAFTHALTDQVVDVLINNAGAFPRGGALGAHDWSADERSFLINSVGPLRVTEALLPQLRAGQTKKVMNVTSRMGSIADNTSGGAYAYRMSKAALNMGTKSMAKDLEPEGFVVFVVHPGWVQTQMGGPNAMITTEQSVDGMLQSLDAATKEDHSGQFVNWNGERLPW